MLSTWVTTHFCRDFERRLKILDSRQQFLNPPAYGLVAEGDCDLYDEVKHDELVEFLPHVRLPTPHGCAAAHADVTSVLVIATDDAVK